MHYHCRHMKSTQLQFGVLFKPVCTSSHILDLGPLSIVIESELSSVGNLYIFMKHCEQLAVIT